MRSLALALVLAACGPVQPVGQSQPAEPEPPAAPATEAAPAAPATEAAQAAEGASPIKAATVLAALRAGKSDVIATLLTGPVAITIENTSSEDPDVAKTLADRGQFSAWLTEMHPCFKADAAEGEECAAMNGLEDPGAATCSGDCCQFYGEEGPMVSHNSLYLWKICFADGGKRLASIHIKDGN